MLAIAGVLSVAAQAQIPGPRWFSASRGMLATPAANADAREIERMERYLTFGVPYCSGLAANQYAANMAMARNMSSYLGTVSTTATDPQARAAALRVAAAFSAFPCAYPGKQLPMMAPLPPPRPGDPPFAMRSPDLGKVPDDQQETAADLVVRYDTDVATSAKVWKNAEQIRLNLSQQGMGMNAQTASAVARLGPLYDDATTALKAHNWDEALSNLQAAEATTQKIATTVGH